MMMRKITQIVCSAISFLVMAACFLSTPAHSQTNVNLWHTIPTETEKFFVEQLMPEFSKKHVDYVMCNFFTIFFL